MNKNEVLHLLNTIGITASHMNAAKNTQSQRETYLLAIQRRIKDITQYVALECVSTPKATYTSVMDMCQLYEKVTEFQTELACHSGALSTAGTLYANTIVELMEEMTRLLQDEKGTGPTEM